MVHYCKTPIITLYQIKWLFSKSATSWIDYRTFPHMVRMFKRNLFKEYQEYWSKSLNKDKFDSSVGNKLSLYSEVKNEVRFESYLDLIKNVKTRVAVTKMRISCHLLPIESGRYKKIPRVERLCPLCNRSEIGDEFHYLLKCTHSSLSHIRGISLESLCLINSNFTNMSWKALFLYIMSMWDENITNLSASYWKYSKLLYIRTLIKPSYHTSSVEVVNSQVIFLLW